MLYIKISKSYVKKNHAFYTKNIILNSQRFQERKLKKVDWTNKTAGDVLTKVEASDYERPPYDKLTYKLPRHNNDLWGLVEINSTSGVLTMTKKLEEEKRHIITLVTHLKKKLFVHICPRESCEQPYV